MQTFSILLQLGQIVIFTLFMANIGNLIIHLLIKDDAKN